MTEYPRKHQHNGSHGDEAQGDSGPFLKGGHRGPVAFAKFNRIFLPPNQVQEKPAAIAAAYGEEPPEFRVAQSPAAGVLLRQPVDLVRQRERAQKNHEYHYDHNDNHKNSFPAHMA